MNYSVTYTSKAAKQLSKLNPQIQKIIYKWIDNNLVNCENPYLHGKALTGDKAGLWRYRVGDYRIIAEILDNELIIQVIEIGHRREIYN